MLRVVNGLRGLLEGFEGCRRLLQLDIQLPRHLGQIRLHRSRSSTDRFPIPMILSEILLDADQVLFKHIHASHPFAGCG
jgi:hypothetical protein